MPQIQAPDLPERGRKLEVRHHGKDPHTNVESLRRLMGSIALTTQVPFTRFLEEDDERTVDCARD